MSEQNKNMNNPRSPCADANRDPITGVSGAHRIGTGLGAVGAGAVAGKAAAEAVNPSVETKHWKENHASRLYADPKLDYDQYGPAYQYGWESFGARGKDGKNFERVEDELGRGWDKVKGTSRLGWEQARAASRDAWDRVELAARRVVGPIRD